jgi:hypothetical protein
MDSAFLISEGGKTRGSETPRREDAEFHEEDTEDTEETARRGSEGEKGST